MEKRTDEKNGNGTAQVLQDAIAVVDQHLRALQSKQHKEIAKAIGRPADAVQQAIDYIRTLDPRPGLQYNKVQARLIEPDVAFIKHGDEWLVLMNDDDLPQLRLNPAYKKLVTRDTNDKTTRDYVKERYKSAIQLIKNIEQRKQTITKVCYCIVARQQDFLERGIDLPETHDDQGGGRRNRRASFHREPCRGQQIRPHTSRRIRAALLLQ